MKLIRSKRSFFEQSRHTQSASTRPLLIAVICFALGATLAAVWFYHQNKADQGSVLSEESRESLASLAAPVNICFYSVLPADSANETLKAFAARVNQLLAAVQQAGNGKIQLTRIESASETNLNAAANAGIQAFNMVKDDACLLGLVISSGANKQIMPRLKPEWEPALQYDLARAILAVSSASASAIPSAVAKPSQTIIDSIHQLVPDVTAVSAEQADQIFHAEFLKECQQCSTEAEAQIKAAQQKVIQAQAGGSADDLAAARKSLLQAQLDQAGKMKQIAADLQTRLAVFQQMKAASSAK